MIITGKIIRGCQAEKAGVRTANVRGTMPPGIYSVRTNFGPGIAAYLDSSPGVVEVHIVDFADEIYGQEITVEVIRELTPILIKVCHELS